MSIVEPGAVKTNIMHAAPTAERAIPDYDAVRIASRQTLRKALKEGGDPRKIAGLILKVARVPSPRLGYGAGSGAHWMPFLKVLLPQRIFDSAVRRGFG